MRAGGETGPRTRGGTRAAVPRVRRGLGRGRGGGAMRAGNPKGPRVDSRVDYPRVVYPPGGAAGDYSLNGEEPNGIGERAGTPEDAALAKKFLNTASPALPKARRP